LPKQNVPVISGTTGWLEHYAVEIVALKIKELFIS
jgi:hypothetical protein